MKEAQFGKKRGVVVQLNIGGSEEAVVAKPREHRRSEQDDLFARKARPLLIEGDLSRLSGREAAVAEPVETQAEML